MSDEFIPIAPEPPLEPEAVNRMGDNENKKSITIRGIDTEVYDDFSTKIKTVGLNIGDAVSKMMTDVLTDFDENFPEISAKGLRRKVASISITHHRSLSISAADLTEDDMGYSFSHIDNLTFEPDVTKEIFLKHVKSVSHCKTVKVSMILPKLRLLSLFSFVPDLQFYDVGQKVEEL